MSAEAFNRRSTKVPPAIKAKPRRERSYDEHTFPQKDRNYEEHYSQQRSRMESTYEDCFQPQKPSVNFKRESEGKEEQVSDFSKMIAMAAARRQGRTCSSSHDWSADQKPPQFPVAKPNETPPPQISSSRLSVTSSSPSVGPSPPSPTPPPRNTFHSATLPHSGSLQMAKSFIQPLASQPPSTSFPTRPSTPSLPLHASSSAPATTSSKPQSSHELLNYHSHPVSQALQQSIAEDDEEIYDDIEVAMAKVPSPLPPTETKQSQPLESGNGPNPPTIPSTPRPSLANIQRSNSHLLSRPPVFLSDGASTQQQSGDIKSSKTESTLSNPMSIGEFVAKYHDEMPVKVKVLDVPQGLGGLRKGDVLNVHFCKTTRVAVVSDNSKAQFIVPFNSAIKFGILFNPFGNTSAATQGYQFPTVGDITRLSSLPPVICARASYEVSAADSSVQKNDVLIVKEVKSHRRGHSLVCIDAKSKQKKKLLESCSGNFSTSPLDISLHLPDVVANVPLPQQCIVSYHGPHSAEISSLLPKGYVVIRSTAVNKTVVASKEGSYMPVADMIKQSSQYLLEIPATLDATVQVMSTSDSIADKLLQNSYDIHQKLSASNFGTTLNYLLQGSNQHQLAFLSTIRNDKPHLGVALTRPTKAVSNIPQSSSALNLAEEAVQDDDEYDIPQLAVKNFLDKQQSQTTSHYDAPRRASLASTSDSTSSDIYDIPGNNAPLYPTTQALSSPSMVSMSQSSESPGFPQEVKDIRRIVERLEKDFTNIRQETDALRKEVATLKQQLNQQGRRQELRPAIESETARQVAAVLSDPQQNKDVLATFNCQQVQHLLREMNLEPYIETFAQEQINGSLLMDCDEHILRDLGIASRLHQMRLMNVISGRSSTKITTEKDHYVTCYKS